MRADPKTREFRNKFDNKALNQFARAEASKVLSESPRSEIPRLAAACEGKRDSQARFLFSETS